jgi:VanZ family protein
MNKILKFWGPVILWMVVIFTFSSIPNLKTDLREDYILRKIAHVLEFAILTFLLIQGLKQEKLNYKKVVLYSLIFALFYALTDEYHQTFVEGRQGSFRDAGIDSIGILLTGLVWYIKSKGRRLEISN